MDPLKKAYGEDLYSQIDFMEADLIDRKALSAAVKGVQYVIHLANPLPGTQHQTEEEMVKPATEGMQTILDAAHESGVKKIIVTSSMAAVVGNVWKRDQGDHHYTEMDYPPYE
jgi:dihydroflavonol-4-reductase